MTDRTWRYLALGLAACGTPPCAAAEEAPGGVTREVPELVQESPSGLGELLLNLVPMARRSKPDWLLEQSHDDMDPERAPGEDGLQLVLQEERRDGADLLTLRYPIAESGALRAYAGAGLHEAVYFSEAETDPALNNRRNRHRSLGPAAEIGTELRLSETINLTADIRWIEIAGDAGVMKSDNGLVGADAVSVGVSIGWRFR